MVSVLAVLSAVITVNLTGDNDARRIAKVADILKRLELEIAGVAPSFKSEVDRYPGRLSDLATRPTTADKNSCQGTSVYTSAQVNATNGAWKGPYHIFPMPVTGYQIASGFLATNMMTRSSPTNVVGTLPIVITNVTRSDAQGLGIVVDGTNTGTGAKVKFGAGDPVTVSYLVTIQGTC